LLQAELEHVLLWLDAAVTARVEKAHEPVAQPQRAAAEVEHGRGGEQTLAQQHFEAEPTDALEVPLGAAEKALLGQAFGAVLQRIRVHAASLVSPSPPGGDCTRCCSSGSARALSPARRRRRSGGHAPLHLSDAPCAQPRPAAARQRCGARYAQLASEARPA